jgi:hypothetical protein
MSGSRVSAVLFLLVGSLAVTSVTTVRAQETPLLVPSLACSANWFCGSPWPPVGFYVDTVSDDGRYITLEDSTIWEVQSTDRAGAAGWERDNFVQVHRVAAPNGDYEWLFTNVTQQDWRAAVRLAGRVRRHR